tara:strand:- start:277 stop:1188 length:912 start_codon:yes stop_codon:yes gene_type:complete
MASQKSTHFPAYGGSTTEQALVQDLVDEHIKIHGSTVFYLPRTLNDVDQLWGEASNSEFKESVQIEMFLKSTDEFDNGMSDTVTEFGLQNNDALTFMVSKRRWTEEFDGNFAGKLADDRPAEGDLIYFPLTKGLFEIKYVEHQAPFYQLGDLYCYELRTELFRYSGEDLDTGVAEIDAIEVQESFKTSLVIDETLTNNATAFTVDEVVAGSVSNANAKVVSWDTTNYILVVYDKTNSFTEGETLTGQTSGASWYLKRSSVSGSTRTETVYIDNSTDQNIVNRVIEVDADSIIDFSEKNPFGEF